MSGLEGLPGYLLEIAGAILRAGYPCYLVGGAVRGGVMGLPAADYDICGPATVEQIVDALQGNQDILPSRVYGGMGTMRLLAGGGYAEYTTFRRERYDGGHTPTEVVFVDSLVVDAFRRDFTCNALYMNLADGAIEDPTGGLADIRRSVLRATTADPSIILRDDGLRVLRMVRFAAQLRFRIDLATFACADPGLLRDIARERMQSELTLILLSDARYDLPGGRDALRAALAQLDEKGIWRMLAPGCQLDFDGCAAMPPDLTLRLAALLRGCGLDAASHTLAGLRYPTKLRSEVVHLVADLESGGDGPAFLLGRGYAHAERLATLRPELGPALAALREANAPESPARLALDGIAAADILGEPSPRVGKALKELWIYAVEHPGSNDAGILAERLREMIRRELV